MKHISIIELNNFINTNLYNKQTTVYYNLVENGVITPFRSITLKGKVSIKKAYIIIDSLYMTNEEFVESYGFEIDNKLIDKHVEFFEF